MSTALLRTASCPGHACAPPARRRNPRIAARASSAPTPPRPEPLQLAGGDFWWLGIRSDTTPVYGHQFVMERQRVGGEGLVAAPRAAVQPFRGGARGGPPAVRPPQPLGLALPGQVVIDTECFEVPPQPSGPAPWGLVHVGAAAAAAESDAPQLGGAARGRHPRRTRRVRFNCNLCGEANERDVNPHAWRAGSVFARCAGCTAVHKLRDNLRIFHELGGPVFPPRHMRESFLVQGLLDKIAERRRRGGGPALPPN